MGVAGAAIASTIAYGVALVAMLRSLWRLPNSDARSGLPLPYQPTIPGGG
jgi:Na+-driven multidrug efflux pump